MMLANLSALLTSPLFWGTFIAASIVSYGMYLVAWLLESRLPGRDVPIWRNQSKAYMPGDFGLSLLVAVGIWLRKTQVLPWWATAWWFAALSVALGVAIFVLARKYLYTPRDYTVAAWQSPSKRYHDFVMFFGFATLAIFVCVPAYFWTDWHGPVIVKIMGLCGLAIWGAGNWYDFTYREVPNTHQHPSSYKPVWR